MLGNIIQLCQILLDRIFGNWLSKRGTPKRESINLHKTSNIIFPRLTILILTINSHGYRELNSIIANSQHIYGDRQYMSALFTLTPVCRRDRRARRTSYSDRNIPHCFFFFDSGSGGLYQQSLNSSKTS